MNRTLTLSEYEAISQEKLSDYPLWSYIAPHQLPRVIHYNQFLSLEITPLLLESDQKLDCIRSCDILEGVKKDKQVRQVAGLIHSLLKEKVISMADYFVEIQTFCVSFMRIKGVVQLFRLASIEARQTKQ
ncbi:hypothetical protein BY458DRAFT_430423 [Sporodiniella umbellata]|nr:hypothetical protein BY458DRAFT_430423 [Sporodiniella umbellata]